MPEISAIRRMILVWACPNTGMYIVLASLHDIYAQPYGDGDDDEEHNDDYKKR